ncbi:MAG: hypothetical protein ABL879_18550, partial [Devosia sp.]
FTMIGYKSHPDAINALNAKLAEFGAINLRALRSGVPNALDVQRAKADAASAWPPRLARRVAHDAWDRGWLSLLDQWGHQNDMRRASGFSHAALARNGSRDRNDDWGDTLDWPAADHVTYFRRQGRAAAVVTEPYGNLGQLDDLRRFLDSRLSVHLPPVKRASFYIPGVTFFVVLTAPDFGPIKWLDDQQTFIQPWQGTRDA